MKKSELKVGLEVCIFATIEKIEPGKITIRSAEGNKAHVSNGMLRPVTVIIGDPIEDADAPEPEHTLSGKEAMEAMLNGKIVEKDATKSRLRMRGNFIEIQFNGRGDWEPSSIGNSELSCHYRIVEA